MFELTIVTLEISSTLPCLGAVIAGMNRRNES